jgi:hypothetical protein
LTGCRSKRNKNNSERSCVSSETLPLKTANLNATSIAQEAPKIIKKKGDPNQEVWRTYKAKDEDECPKGEKRLLKMLRTTARKKAKTDKLVPPTVGPVGLNAKQKDLKDPTILETSGYNETHKSEMSQPTADETPIKHGKKQDSIREYSVLHDIIDKIEDAQKPKIVFSKEKMHTIEIDIGPVRP